MGAPELPGDPVEEEVHAVQANVHHPPMASDDSDNEINTDAYNGYQPLPIGDEGYEMAVDDSESVDSITDEVIQDQERDLASEDTLVESTPKIDSVDVEIERQVWSEPRPKELQLELDNNKTTQILNVMANITLPNAVVPDWAASVPEERWKEELLQRIRQREDSNLNIDK
ncbi:uncharacterized protein LOC101461826 [Ceratitis capitata]|uniref:Male-enhanced antigen 1 n=1 Tax=Ceratitis capitata TaxID=7213 RepID=W8CDM4_CERCA|nr:uncharacterized protein LOC101461826 [Ceratitis capitata]XP_012160014.1 uncharacterized protein LOC101461826 [Ceratitis capitata]CAD6999158.1 unnamed protein product [Ceratitis capitata]